MDEGAREGEGGKRSQVEDGEATVGPARLDQRESV